MMMVPAIALHILGAVVWIGGMLFMLACLRPALGLLDDPSRRLLLVRAVLGRFFRWVWAAALLLPATGFWMAKELYGSHPWPISILIMAILGTVMVMLFLYVFFMPWRRLRLALDSDKADAASASLERIRRVITLNLILGMIVVVVASAGRYL